MAKDTNTTTTEPTVYEDLNKLADIAIQRKRQEAPEVSAAMAGEIDQKRLMRVHLPESVGPKATVHAMFAGKDDLRQLCSQEGYKIKLDRGQPVTYGSQGDALVYIPKDLYDRRLKIEAERGQRFLQKKRDADKAEVMANPACGGVEIKSRGDEPS